MLPSHIVAIQDNYKSEEGISDSVNNVDDTGVFPSFFSFWTSFWLILDSIFL